MHCEIRHVSSGGGGIFLIADIFLKLKIELSWGPPPPLFGDQVSNGSENKEEITVAKRMLHTSLSVFHPVNSFFLTCMTCEFSLLFNINHIFQIICKPFNNVTYHVNNEGISFFFYGEGVINHLNSLNKDSKI